MYLIFICRLCVVYLLSVFISRFHINELGNSIVGSSALDYSKVRSISQIFAEIIAYCIFNIALIVENGGVCRSSGHRLYHSHNACHQNTDDSHCNNKLDKSKRF